MTTTHGAAFKNAIVLTAMKVVAPMLSLALVLGVSRLLGAEGMGRYTLILAFHTFFTAVSPFGLHAFLMREGARDPERFSALLLHCLVFGTVSATVMVPVMASVGWLFGYDAITQVALGVMAVAIIPTTLQTYFDAVFVSRERTEFIAIGAGLDLLVRVGLGLWLLLQGYQIVAIALTFLGGQTLAAAASFLLLRRVGVSVRLSIEPPLFRKLAGTGVTFLAISIFATIYWRIDVLMLSLMTNIEEVGLYGVAYRMMEIAKILPQNICLALYPAVSQAASVDPARLPWLGRSAVRYMWMITLPVAVGATILAKPILALTVGEAFASATTVLAVLLWTIIPYGLARYYAFVLVAAERQRVDLWLNVCMSAVNVLLNLILIPRWGALGAATATSVSIALYLGCQYAYLRRHLPDHLAPMPPLWKPIIATAVMAGLVWWLRDLNVLIVIAAGAAVYLAALLVTRFFSVRELQVLRLGRLTGVVGAGD